MNCRKQDYTCMAGLERIKYKVKIEDKWYNG